MNEGAFDQIIPSELTSRDESNFTFGERFSLGITKAVLSLSDFSEVAKTYAEKIGMNIEHADYWLTYVLSELKTGLAGEKGGWGINYVLNSIDSIPKDVMREHFVSDMLWEMYQDVGEGKQLAALKLTSSFDEHGQLAKLDFHPDIRDWPITVRVFKQIDGDEPTTFVDVVIEKDAAKRTLSSQMELAGYDRSSLDNPFSLVNWQEIIKGETGLPENVQGIRVSEERLLTDWYAEPTNDPEAAPKHPSDFFAKPDIVIGLKTANFQPGNAFYDPRPTLVLCIDEQTHAVSFKLPTHVSFDGKDVTNAWKALSEKKLYKHFLKRITPKNHLRNVMRQSGLFDPKITKKSSWLSNRNREQGIDGGNTHLIEAELQEAPFEHEGAKEFAELMNVRRIQASRELPDFLLDAVKKFRKQPELLSKYGDIKTSALIMIALYLVDGRLPGMPIDPDDGRLGITSMGNRMLESLLASREILTSSSDELERHLIKVQMADLWLMLIGNDSNSSEALETLRGYLTNIDKYNFDNFDVEIKNIFQTQKEDGEIISITDQRILNFFDKIMPFLEKNENKNELLFKLLGWLIPTNDNTSPLPNLEEFFSALSIEQSDVAILIKDFRELISLTNGKNYEKDQKNELLLRIKPIYDLHSSLEKSKKQSSTNLEAVGDLKKILDEYTDESKFIVELEKFLGKFPSRIQHAILGRSFMDEHAKPLDQEKLSPEQVVEEVLKLVDADKKRSNFDKMRKALRGAITHRQLPIDVDKLPTSSASLNEIVKQLANGPKNLGQASHLEKLYREVTPTNEDIQSVLAHLDIVFAALFEIAEMEFSSEEERMLALSETYSSLKLFTDADSIFPVHFMYSSFKNLDWPKDKNRLQDFIAEQRTNVFRDVMRAHRRNGLLYKLQNWEQQVIDLDSAQVHRFTSEVMDAGVKTSKVIDMMGRDVKRAASSISARLSSAQFLEKTANVLAPAIMADLRPLSNVSSLGAVENQNSLDLDVIFPTANAGHSTNVGWGLYGDILTYSCSADDPKELVEVVLPFIRANDKLTAAFLQFIFPSRGSELRQKVIDMVQGREYLCSTEEVDSEIEKEEKRKLREQGYVLSSKQRKENFQASANMIDRLKMMENDDYFLKTFAEFCRGVLDKSITVLPEVYGLVDNYVKEGFRQTWEAQAQYRLAHFSTEMLNVLFILQSGLTPGKSLEELRKLMQVDQDAYRVAIDRLIDVYKKQSDDKQFMPAKTETEAAQVPDDRAKKAALEMLVKTKELI